MSYRTSSMSRPQLRRKAVAATRAMSPIDQLWVWRGAFALGIAAWAAVALLIKAIV
jgi:hypothetical protein